MIDDGHSQMPPQPIEDYRRAWMTCKKCTASDDCVTCRGNRTGERLGNCDIHWLYLTASNGSVISVKCPHCERAYSFDTGTHGPPKPKIDTSDPWYIKANLAGKFGVTPAFLKWAPGTIRKDLPDTDSPQFQF